ncbi:MAG: hypothetical protein JW741_27370 [Sedimentisphaerales bacterium]|nr:hypothetical protein [Sedimentisphaerales bacterium]
MRWKLLLSSAMIVVLANLVCARTASQETKDQRDFAQETRQAAAEMLEGRGLVVRIYPEPQNDPARSVLVTVSIHDLAVEFSALKKASPSISESAYVLIRAEDQKDQGIATVLTPYVCLRTYRSDYRQTIWFQAGRSRYSDGWTFFDALGNPMTGASVTMEMRPSDDVETPPIRLGTAQSDGEGRLARLLEGAGMLTMRVEHPDYGIATAQMMRSEENPDGIYVVPMVPKNSEAMASAIQGTVVDTEGRPLASIPVFSATAGSAGDNDCYHKLFVSRAITNEQGWFALCWPTMTKDFVLRGLPAPGTRHEITIEPPTTLNLRRLGGVRPLTVSGGVPNTFTLAPLAGEESFHTFSFESFDGPVTDEKELANIELVLRRDERTWARLRYDQFKDGYVLPPGELRARTFGWHGPVGFGPVELTAESPEHIVFRSGSPITYRGRVVKNGTGRPMANVVVLANHSLRDTDPCSLKPRQWEDLVTQAAQAAAGLTPKQTLYSARNRVTKTDRDGLFEIVLLPANGERLSFFSAMAPGYSVAATVQPPTSRPSPEGIIEVPTITLSPQSEKYFPRFVVEDESGPVTDPDKLDKVQIDIRYGNRSSGRFLSRFVRERQFQAGIYHARAVWDGQLCTFRPVDLTTARPDVVVFKPEQVRPTRLTYQGLVVNGLTGAPIAGALVVCNVSLGAPDASAVEPCQWEAIRALGPNPDPNDPALALVLNGFDRDWRPNAMAFALTDRQGAFCLVAEHQVGLPMASMAVLAEGFMGTPAGLSGRGSADPRTPMQSLRFEPDENGVVTLPNALKLYPAATVSLCPVVPDPGNRDSTRTRAYLHWSAAPGESARWLTELNGMARRFALRPNVEQTVHVPAGVNLTLIARFDSERGWLPVQLGQVRLQQGEVTEFGRVGFTTGIGVTVRVVDPNGAPMEGVTIFSTDSDRLLLYTNQRTDTEGIARLNVPAHSTGCLCALAIDPVTRERIEEHVGYEVGGEEDAGKEFTLRLSDAFLEQLTTSPR